MMNTQGSRSKTPSRKANVESAAVLHQMRNLLYQGQLSSCYLLNGSGVALTDNNIVYAGEFKHDQPHGFGLMLFDSNLRLDIDKKAHLHFNGENKHFLIAGHWLRGRPYGPALLLTHSVLLITNFDREGQVDGLLHRFEHASNTWHTYQYSRGNKQRLVQSGSTPPSTLRNNAEHYRLFLSYADRNFAGLGAKMGKLSLSMFSSEGLECLGFSKEGVLEGLGVKTNNYCVVEAGVYSWGKLHGYGFRKLNDFSFYEGDFKQGEFQGLGLFHSFSRNTFIVGSFYRGKCIKIYTEGRGRGRQIYIKIKDLQIRNHPKVISKLIHLDEVSLKLMAQIERHEKTESDELPIASPTEKERLEAEHRIDRLNQIITEETLSSDRLLRELMSMGHSPSQKPGINIFQSKLQEFKLEGSRFHNLQFQEQQKHMNSTSPLKRSKLFSSGVSKRAKIFVQDQFREQSSGRPNPIYKDEEQAMDADEERQPYNRYRMEIERI